MDPNIPRTRNPFSTFATNPMGVTFETQEEGEVIILLLRAHIVTLVPAVILVIFLSVLPIIVLSFFSVFRVDLNAFLNPGQFLLVLVFWYLLVFAYTLYRFIFWYFNVYILTNERVIDFDFRGILHKETAYAKLNQIQDVAPKSIGFFSTFFHFGDVYIQTAGEMREFDFHKVPRPDFVAQRILVESRREEGETPGVIE